MTNNVGESIEVLNQIKQKKQKTTQKSGLPGNHGPSEVWVYFEKVVDKETNKYIGTSICKSCKALVIAPSKSGTNKMWNHIRTCKKISRDEQNNALVTMVGGQVSNWKFNQERCRRSLTKMLILCELPFSFVEKVGFKKFCSDMQPKFHVVSRTTVTKDCIQLFYEEKKKLKSYFKEMSARVCITTDLWTSIQNLGYMALTAHFVDKDWSIRKKIIYFRVLPHPHKGETISKAIENCLLEWGLEKAMTITLDNAKNNDTCIVDLKKRLTKRNMMLLDGQFFHVRCFAHVINLVVRDGVEEMKTTIKRLRRSVKYVRSSPSRMKLFRKRALEESVTSKKVVCLDVKTRWNSTYLMIDSAMQFERVSDRLLEQDPIYKIECGDGSPLDESDWRKLKSLHTFLKDFYLLTKRISGSHYIASNIYFDEVTQVKDLLMLHIDSPNMFLSTMAKKMNEKFEKYCNLDSLNPILIISIVLDPRYKLDYVSFWYRGYLDNDILLSEKDKDKTLYDWIERIKGLMSRLYFHYNDEVTSLGDQSSTLQGDVTNVGGNRSKKEIFRNRLKRKELANANNDLDKYLSDGIEDDTPSFDVLLWSKGKHAIYPTLAIMARNVLSIPITSAASECAFSTAGRVLDPFRSSLTPTVVESLVCTQDWLRDPILECEGVEEKYEELDAIEHVLSQEIGGMSLE